jgi:hypothetical protein
MMLLLFYLNPFMFTKQNEHQRIVLYTYTMLSMVIIPVVSILLMKNLNIIKSIRMEDKMDRVGPLIVVSIVYLWLFINFKNSTSVPPVFAAVMLGGSIAVLTAFFINNFTKISLHAIGMGSLIAATLLMELKLNYGGISIMISSSYTIDIAFYTFVIVAVIMAGLVGMSRLDLNAHSTSQLYLGYATGFLSQLIAFNVII